MRQAVLGCVSRAQSSFATGNQNFVDTAINNSLIYAQRRCDFEWCKGEVSVDCNPFGNIITATDTEGQQVMIKRILKAFGVKQPQVGLGTSIPYLSRVSQIADDTTGKASSCHCSCSGNRVVHEGRKVFHMPEIKGPHKLYFYAVKWLPRLVKPEDTNFLLDFAFDYIMYKSILELNHYIKEDERFRVSSTLLTEAWESLLTWDAHLVSMTETEIEL